MDGEECAPNVKIFDGTYLPQIICDIGAIVSIKSKNVYNDFWFLTALSAIFQLYHGDQF